MSEKTKQSSLSCTCKEMVWFVNFWSRDWEGRRPWMTSLRKVEENGRMVRRRTRETTQLRKRRVVFPAPATSTLTAHTAQQLCSEFHQRRNLEFLCSFFFFFRSESSFCAAQQTHGKRSSTCAGGGLAVSVGKTGSARLLRVKQK